MVFAHEIRLHDFYDFFWNYEMTSSDLKIIIDELDKRHAFLDAVDKYYYEAILQHYGFKTRYIDFVDNIWVALVFFIFIMA